MGKSDWKGGEANKEYVNEQFATHFYWNIPRGEGVAVFIY